MIEPGTLTNINKTFYFYLSSYKCRNFETGYSTFIFTGFVDDRFGVHYQLTDHLEPDESVLT